MATKGNPVLFFIFICALGALFSGCWPIIAGCPNSTYNFELDAQVTPDKDTVNVGDTIWVEINSPVVFLDQTLNQEINFSAADNFGTDMGFVKLVNRSPIKLDSAVNEFNFDLVYGTETPTVLSPGLIKNYLVAEINGRYLFKLGVIPKDTGTFSFNLGNATGVTRRGKSCPRADFYTRLIQTNQHYYLYPGGNNVTPGGADYYFYVK